jgi:hypothetical protein
LTLRLPAPCPLSAQRRRLAAYGATHARLPAAQRSHRGQLLPHLRSAQARTSQAGLIPFPLTPLLLGLVVSRHQFGPKRLSCFNSTRPQLAFTPLCPLAPTSSRAWSHRVSIQGSFPPSAMALRSGFALSVDSSHPTNSIPSGRTVRLTSHPSLPCAPKPSCYRHPCTADAVVPPRSAAAPLWSHAASRLCHPLAPPPTAPANASAESRVSWGCSRSS